MASIAQAFYPNTTAVAGLPANTFDCIDTVPGAVTSTTITTHSGTGNTNVQLVPFVTSTTTSASIIGAAGKGWRFKAATDVAATSTAQRIVPAGTWNFSGFATTSGLAGQSVTMTVVVNRVSAAGALTELFRATSAAVGLLTTSSTVITAVSAAQPQITLAAGETLQFEYWSTAPGAAVTGNAQSVTWSITSTNWSITVPSPGIRTQYIYTPSESAPASDAIGVQINRVRALADSAPGVDVLAARQILSRPLADAAPAVDALTRVQMLKRGSAETAPATESLVRRVTGARALADTAPGSDVLVARQVLSRSLLDSAPAADSLLRRVTLVRALAENIGPSGGGTTTTITVAPPFILVDGSPAIKVGATLYTKV